MPEVVFEGGQRNGSVCIEGLLDIRSEETCGSLFHQTRIKGENHKYAVLSTNNYQIKEIISPKQKAGSSDVEGGLYKREVKVKLNKNKPIKITIFGTKKTMDLVKENETILAVPVIYSPNLSNHQNKPFALLVKDGKETVRTSGEDQEKLKVYHRLGLVELSEKLEERQEKNSIAIGSENSQEQSQQQALQIQPAYGTPGSSNK
jgi:hypothetical protein